MTPATGRAGGRSRCRSEQGAARRKQAADALAPGGENGIGAPTARGDTDRAAVMATLPLSADEPSAQCAAEGLTVAAADPGSEEG